VSGKIRNVGALVSGRVTDAGVLVSGRVKGVGGMVFPVDVTPVLWTPAEISGSILAWYSGSDLIMSGVDVVGATDLSGNGADAVVTGTGTLSATTWNSIGAVQGSESTRALSTPISPASVRGYIATVDRDADAGTALVDLGSTSRYSCIFTASALTTLSGTGGLLDAIHLNGDPGAIGVTTRQNVYDAVSTGGGVVYCGCPSLTAIANMRMLTYPNAGFYFSGKWGDFIWLSTTLDAATIDKLEGYLAWRRGTVAKLPIDHPYKLAPPYV
jgi:hypothetical protein